MRFIQFNIFRKAAFAGALLPYNIYINGRFAGVIKNGKSISVKIPEADVYYIEDNNSFERNAVVFSDNESEYNIILKRAGGWKTDSYNEFYIEKNKEIKQLPSFHFERFMNAVFEKNIDQLSSDEQLLALCLDFSYSIMDDIQEVLESSNLSRTIDALQTIGACQYHNQLTQIIEEDFHDVSLPLNDEQTEQLYDRLNKANRLIWNNEGLAYEELRMAIVRHIIENLTNTNYIY